MKKGKKAGKALILAAALALGLCACGGGKKAEADPNLAKQNVYSYIDLNLGDALQDASVSQISTDGNRVYLLVQRYESNYDEETDTYSSDNTCILLSVNLDGSDLQSKVLEDAGDYLTKEGLPAPEGEDVPEEEPAPEGEEEPAGEWEMSSLQSWVNGTCMGSDGTLCTVEEAYVQQRLDEETYSDNQYLFLNYYTPQGELAWHKILYDGSQSSDYYYVNSLGMDREGNVYAFSQSGEPLMLGFNREGDEILRETLELEDRQLGGVLFGFDGKALITAYNNEYTKMTLIPYDLKTGQMQEALEAPDWLNRYSMFSGTDTDMILTDNSGVYTYNLGDAEPVKVIDTVNSDLPTNRLNYFCPIDDQHFVALYSDMSDDWTSHVSYFTRVDPKDIPDKKVLVLAANYVDSSVKNRVVAFNKTNPTYRITIKDYSAYQTMEDYFASYTQLNNDIISGNTPDIIVVDGNIPVDNYIKKGVLADIDKLIAQDEELSGKEFMQNFFDAYRVNGKLYEVIPSFDVETMVAKKSVVGDLTGWTMSEMLDFLENKMPEGCQPFGGGQILRDTFMYMVMNYSGANFVDTQEGKCYFDTQEFMDLLTYAKSLPTEYTDDGGISYGVYDAVGESQKSFRNDTILMTSMYVSRIADTIYTVKGEVGEEVAFVGFPCSDRQGSIVESYGYSYALSARSANLDGAWEFVRYYLTDEYQMSDEIYGLPASREAFDKQAETAMERPYWINEDGGKEYYDYTYWENDEQIILEPYTEQEIQTIKDFLTTVNKRPYSNEEIQKIIDEEAAAFYQDQKPVEEVVKIIQSRAQVYLDENS